MLDKEFRIASLSNQILRSGTAIGAILREAEFAESPKDFFAHKMSMSLKEANETKYWLALLHETAYINEKLFHSLVTDCEELIKMLVSSIKTIKAKIKSKK